MNTYAFIDGQNLHRGVKELGWTLDYQKFHDYLRRHYRVARALYFIGQMPQHQHIYDRLQRCGYELVFKPVVQGPGHDPKGNVDADLILRAMIEFPNYDRAVLVAGDGDYYSLTRHLRLQRKLHAVLSPNRRFCSALLKQEARGQLWFVEDLRHLVQR